MTNEELKERIADIIIANKKKRKTKMIKGIFGSIVGIIGGIIIVNTLGWLPLLGIILLLWSDNIGNNISTKSDK